MAGKVAYERIGGGVNKSTVLGPGFAAHLLQNRADGSGTDRSTYHYNPAGGPTGLHSYNPMGAAGSSASAKEDKSFTSPSQGASHGAVSALNLVGAGLTTPQP